MKIQRSILSLSLSLMSYMGIAQFSGNSFAVAQGANFVGRQQSAYFARSYQLGSTSSLILFNSQHTVPYKVPTDTTFIITGISLVRSTGSYDSACHVTVKVAEYDSNLGLFNTTYSIPILVPGISASWQLSWFSQQGISCIPVYANFGSPTNITSDITVLFQSDTPTGADTGYIMYISGWKTWH